MFCFLLLLLLMSECVVASVAAAVAVDGRTHAATGNGVVIDAIEFGFVQNVYFFAYCT